jgi:hypothetical protein
LRLATEAKGVGADQVWILLVVVRSQTEPRERLGANFDDDTVGSFDFLNGAEDVRILLQRGLNRFFERESKR